MERYTDNFFFVSSNFYTNWKKTKMTKDYFVCIENSDYQVSLERWKIYRSKNNPEAETLGLLNIVNESGESYLYPIELFMKIELPVSLKRKMRIKSK